MSCYETNNRPQNSEATTRSRKVVPFVWTDRQQAAFEALKACLLRAPILGFPTEDGRFLLDTDASLYAVGGVLNQLQGNREVVIAYEQKRGGPGVPGHPQLPPPKENPGNLSRVLESSMPYPAGIGRIGPGHPD